jgi:hypothetical protein
MEYTYASTLPAWDVLPFYEHLWLDEELPNSPALCGVYSGSKLFIMTRINIYWRCVCRFLLFSAVTPRGDYVLIYAVTKKGDNGLCMDFWVSTMLLPRNWQALKERIVWTIYGLCYSVINQ